LSWLAWRLWTAPATAIETGASAAATGRPALADAMGGLAVALANPKTMLFYLALVPQLVDARAVDLGGFVELAAIVVALYAGVLAAYVRAAAHARRAFATPAAMRRVQRGSAVLLAGTAAAVATRG
jgi:threonine/homoserine/homoserine lactone efflux protein